MTNIVAALPRPMSVAPTFHSGQDITEKVVQGKLDEKEAKGQEIVYKLTDADKEFSPSDTAQSPQTDNSLLIIQAVLNGLSVLAFALGPDGIPISAVLTFASSALSAVPASRGSAIDSLRAYSDIVKEKLRANELQKHLDWVSSYGSWLEVHRALFQALELDDEGKSHAYAHGGSFEANLAYLQDDILPVLRRKSAPGTQSLYDGLTGLADEAVHPPWNRPDIRGAYLLMKTTLFITYKYLALFEARYSAYLLEQGDTKLAGERMGAYYGHLDDLRDEIAKALPIVKANIDRLRKWRQDQVTEVENVDHSRGVFQDAMMTSSHDPDPIARSFWSDKYNGKGEHRHDAKRIGIFTKDWDYSGSHKVAQEERDAYVVRLNAHIDRVLHPDEAIHAIWESTLAATRTFMVPPQPILTEYEPELQDVANPSEWLHDAKSVQYFYKVTNMFGTSPPSQYTPSFDMPRLPTLLLKSLAGREITFEVWHRKQLANGVYEEALAGKVDGGIDGKVFKWTDKHQNQPAGR